MPAAANLVHMQSSTTGTGNLTVAAVNGKQAFGTAFGTGVTTDVFDYFISNQAAAEWERGTGHMSNSTTLVRDTVKESTNSNAAVNFSAGTKDVTNDIPAALQVQTSQIRTKLTANTTYYVRTVPVAATSISNASPAVVTATSHGLTTNDPVVFSTTGTLPTGLTVGTVYYVISAGLTANAFQVSATQGGAAINTTGAGSGTHSFATGNDANSGTAQTRAGAWLTLQYALDYIAAYVDLAGFALTIQMGAGTHSAGVTCLGYAFEGGIPKVKGDTTTPSNVVISVASGTCFDLRRGTRLYIEGLKLVSAAEHGIHVSSSSYIGITGLMEFGACSIYHMTADHESTIGIAANYTISGGAQSHWNANNNSDIEIVQGPPAITLTGTPTFSVAFAQAARGGIIESSATFSGSATATQFLATLPGYVSASNTLPGSTAGTYTSVLPTIGSVQLIGDGTARSIGAVTPIFQSHGTSTNTAASAVYRWSADTGPARAFLAKSRGASVGTNAIVVNGDTLSEWITYADGGSGFQAASSVRSTVDGTPGAASDMPTKMELMVSADGTATLAAGLTIRQDKTVELNGISTTASAANAFIDNASNNRILRSTSSLTYKTDVESVDPAIADAFLKAAQPIWYHSLASADKLDDGGMKSFYSFGAEALAEIDPRLVNWGYQPQHFETVIEVTEEGDNVEKRVLKPGARTVPDGVNDRAIIAILTSIVQRQEARIAALEARG